MNSGKFSESDDSTNGDAYVDISSSRTFMPRYLLKSQMLCCKTHNRRGMHLGENPGSRANSCRIDDRLLRGIEQYERRAFRVIGEGVMRHRTSQVISLDVLLSFVLLLFCIVAALWMFMYLSTQSESTSARIDLRFIANKVHSQLFDTTGSTANWYNLTAAQFNTSSVRSLGVSSGVYGVLDPIRLSRIVALNSTEYADIRTALGVLGPGYDVYASVSLWNGSVFPLPQYAFGVRNETASQHVVVERILTLNGTWAKARVEVSG